MSKVYWLIQDITDLNAQVRTKKLYVLIVIVMSGNHTKNNLVCKMFYKSKNLHGYEWLPPYALAIDALSKDRNRTEN